MKVSRVGAVMVRVYTAATAALAAVAVVAVVVTALMWWKQRDDGNDLSTQATVERAAADWASVLINLSDDNGNAGVETLRDNTTGDLHGQFDTVVQPYRDELRTLHSSIDGQINSVSLESVHQHVDAAPADTVLVVGTTEGNNAGGSAQTIHWYLRIGVTDVSGKQLIRSVERIQ